MTHSTSIAIKQLIIKYLECTQHVPMRAVDCDQDTEEELRNKLWDLIEGDNE